MSCRSPKALRFMRQSVSLTGLGTERFKSNMTSINNIQLAFMREFEDNALSSSYGSSESIDISNRYFVTRTKAPDASPVEFHPSIDPTGELRRLASIYFIHTEDNQVQYFEKCSTSGR